MSNTNVKMWNIIKLTRKNTFINNISTTNASILLGHQLILSINNINNNYRLRHDNVVIVNQGANRVACKY